MTTIQGTATVIPKEYHLVVSHNNRIQSWLDPLLKTNTEMKQFYDIHKKIRFSNCAAISLEFTSADVTISLVDAGDETSNKKPDKKSPIPYWATDISGVDKTTGKILFNTIKIDIEIFKKVFLKTEPFANSISKLIDKNFLIVRHGEAVHNDKKRIKAEQHKYVSKYGYNSITDTLLTNQGIMQGNKLGKRLKSNSNIKINTTCYVSDLIRTSMTAWAIGSGLSFEPKESNSEEPGLSNSEEPGLSNSEEPGLSNSELENEYFEKYIVVPCNHELPSEKGKEKNKLAFYKFKSWSSAQPENKSNCFNKLNLEYKKCNRIFYYRKNNDQTDTPFQINLTDKLNWDHYLAYYTNLTKSNFTKKRYNSRFLSEKNRFITCNGVGNFFIQLNECLKSDTAALNDTAPAPAGGYKRKTKKNKRKTRKSNQNKRKTRKNKY
jgi:phosphohistidine phosphatase SixA